MQLGAFQILLNENHLSPEEQERALQNIKAAYETLQQEYRDARDEYDKQRRQGAIPDDSPAVFDEDKVIEGELYKVMLWILS